MRPSRLLGFALAMALVLSGAHAGAQTAGLKIVVIDGEDAVNVIQQKTAVAPVVEVRDKNNQPIAGAVVRFAIQGGRASFSGARTLTVTTNLAGRAAVSSLTPASSGAFQITASAAFQGQTAAITIAQTNVLTAAQAAAAASGAGAGGGAGASGGAAAGGSSGGASAGASGAAAGGAGGGMSATTIGIVAGAAAGGAVAAKEVVSGEGGGATSYSGSYSGTMDTLFGSGSTVACTITEASTGSVTIKLTAAADGTVTGTGDTNGTLTPTRSTCAFQLGIDTHGCCAPDPPLQGTKSNMTFHGSHPGNVGTVWVYDFTGALNGSEIDGTFTLTVTNPGQPTSSGSWPVTLR